MSYNPNNLPSNSSIIPRGDNSLDSLMSYLESFIYEASYPTGETFAADPIDLRHGQRFLYGRVDTNGFCIVPDPKLMKQLKTSDGKIHSALDFVADNYNKMVNYHARLKSKGKIKSESSFSLLTPHKSWKDQESFYQGYLTTFFETFTSTVLSSGSDKKIKDYDSFEKVFLSFCKRLTNYGMPITRTSFVKDFHGSPISSGVALEIAEKPHSDDFVKFSEFIRDPNFEVFRAMTNRFGFAVDKNAPWRIICDLKSPYIKSEMKNKGIPDLSSLFEHYYIRTHEKEMENIKNIFLSFYNDFVEENPEYEEVSQCGVDFYLRNPITNSEAEDRLSSSHWIRVLAYIRALETERPWTQHKFDTVVSETCKIYKYRDPKHALTHLERHFVNNREKFLQKGLTKKDKFGRIIGKSNKSVQKFRF